MNRLINTKNASLNEMSFPLRRMEPDEQGRELTPQMGTRNEDTGSEDSTLSES